MARSKRNKRKSRQDSVLESVFGIKLDADAGDGDSPAPNPKPEVGPAAVEAQADALAEKRERAAHVAEIRSAAVEVARKAGVKTHRAPAFVKLIDFSGVAVDSEGAPDTAEIERLVRAGTEEYPELTTASGSLYGSAPGAR